ncbi:1-phosphatidylinositol 4,5-bisphosphate phosphodiesterase beta-1 [Manis javanica]|nr:1-phosphatidylinositol 4,5-bisphosphate phosphodiesterase beta-1 [Manis javanica]
MPRRILPDAKPESSSARIAQHLNIFRSSSSFYFFIINTVEDLKKKNLFAAVLAQPCGTRTDGGSLFLLLADQRQPTEVLRDLYLHKSFRSGNLMSGDTGSSRANSGAGRQPGPKNETPDSVKDKGRRRDNEQECCCGGFEKSEQNTPVPVQKLRERETETLAPGYPWANGESR